MAVRRAGRFQKANHGTCHPGAGRPGDGPVLDAALFVFTNRRRTQCRILYWERCGFVLWQKRLERARFAWPRRADAMVNLSGAQLNSLLDGYDLWRMRAHQQLHYASMY